MPAAGAAFGAAAAPPAERPSLRAERQQCRARALRRGAADAAGQGEGGAAAARAPGSNRSWLAAVAEVPEANRLAVEAFYVDQCPRLCAASRR